MALPFLSHPWNSGTVVRQAGSRRQAHSSSSFRGAMSGRQTGKLGGALEEEEGSRLRMLGRLGPQAGLSIPADGQSPLGAVARAGTTPGSEAGRASQCEISWLQPESVLCR